ncbi:IS66-like element accessory protein TnpA [Stutzerimonas stutzeri]|uniref:IS66-like element accessory protein TnpA n=1 Tax=Stutzerimonas stutzeri TaxID=316 RepID=UPI00210E603D|nr:transposase [Stutzerimonas stutzeri]
MSRQRRTFPKAFKAQVIEECAQSGTSVAGVALSHGLNANLVHKWIRKQREPLPVVSARFIPVPLGILPSEQASSEELTIRIEIPYHAGSLSVHWPVQDGEGCTRLLRGLLA